ncbi:MAG: RtcB family protein [Bacteroidota bacterium]
MFEIRGKYTTAKIMSSSLEEECHQQIETMVNHSFFQNPVVIMPDVHKGKGSVIGFTMPLTDRVIPNVIGVDIGCGMLTAEIGSKLPLSFDKLDKIIRQNVPLGHKTHGKAVVRKLDYKEPADMLRRFIMAYNKKTGKNFGIEKYNDNWLKEKFAMTGADPSGFFRSIGTLGGGNHFIEIGKGSDNYFLTIHSGSRNFGLKIAEYWQREAVHLLQQPEEDYDIKVQEILETVKEKKKAGKMIRKLRRQGTAGKNRELAGLTGEAMMGYLTDMVFAQYYAHLNRLTMLELITNSICAEVSRTIESVHNYIDFRDFIIRKGAIRSYRDEEMIIPFNMRDGILLCRGKSNQDWNLSAPHGAGRVFSRSRAMKEIKLEDFKKSMEGIYSSSVSSTTIDESPFAYKSAAMIEKAIEPTAEIIDRIVPVYNLKA